MTDTLQNITNAQKQASNPNNSVWVSASAGSGKTKVLTDRVLNLLLTNTPPEKILCLTFTKAAAAEMSNRINKTLKSWATLSDDELIDELKQLNDFVITDDLIKKARCLFVKVLETPGGMKIMTLHSFCGSILMRFPFEAGIAPQSEVIDELQEKEILKQCALDVLENEQYQNDILQVSHFLDDNNISSFVFDMITSYQEKLKACRDEYKNVDTLKLKLKQYFNLSNYNTEKEVINKHFSIDEYEELKSKYIKVDATGVFAKYKNDAQAHLVFLVFNQLKNFRLIGFTLPFMRLIFAILKKYDDFKAKNSYLAYTDLIVLTNNLLQKQNMSAWVLYKLDGGINHILVDEAQDTSPTQWQIIKSLSEEFFAGDGCVKEMIRTLFVVGDKKQSIFSVQGADPTEFEKMHAFFNQKITSSGQVFKTVPLNMSFRSTSPVLDLVNAVLDDPFAKNGILHHDEMAPHSAYRANEAGLVEIWPPEYKEKQDKNDGWQLPILTKGIMHPAEKVAEKIATKIRQMLDDKEILTSQNRPIKPSDIMILVSKRNHIVPALLKSLQEKNIPVAGVDRLMLTDHIAVQDLLSIAQFVLLPEDDLNLACLLKSPLFNLSEDDLFLLAHNRQGKSLWWQLSTYFPDVKTRLLDLLNKADFMPLFEFYAYLLGPLNARKAFVTRFGFEVNEALDEFLNLTLSFEHKHIPSLNEFVKWIKNQSIVVKRDLEQGDLNAVRIMTIHASKGLQGNIVFLPDTMRLSKISPNFMFLPNNLPLWLITKEHQSIDIKEMIDEKRAQQKQENHRLFYVALTRAKDRLYITGFNSVRCEPDEANPSFYDLIYKSALTLKAPDEQGVICLTSPQLAPIKADNNKTDETPDIVLPDYVFTPAPAYKTTDVVMPSKTETSQNEKALKQGTFVHHLLEKLPLIETENWQSYIESIQSDDVVVPNNLLNLLTSDEFKFLFEPNALSEVPVTGMVDNQLISGKIDKLVVKDDEVLIIDYKSNKNPPLTADNVPQNYKMQLNAYKCLLKSIFPDKNIKTYLLWTQTLNLMEIQ